MHRQMGDDFGFRPRRQARHAPQHGRDDVVEGEHGGGGKARQNDHGLAIADRQAEGLAGLQGDPMGDDAGAPEPRDDAIGEIARALGGAPPTGSACRSGRARHAWRIRGPLRHRRWSRETAARRHVPPRPPPPWGRLCRRSARALVRRPVAPAHRRWRAPPHGAWRSHRARPRRRPPACRFRARQ